MPFATKALPSQRSCDSKSGPRRWWAVTASWQILNLRWHALTRWHQLTKLLTARCRSRIEFECLLQCSKMRRVNGRQKRTVRIPAQLMTEHHQLTAPPFSGLNLCKTDVLFQTSPGLRPLLPPTWRSGRIFSQVSSKMAIFLHLWVLLLTSWK